MRRHFRPKKRIEEEETMTEKRNMTKEDVFLEARIRSEGVRIEVINKPATWDLFRSIVMDGCELVVGLWENPYSRLEAIIDGDHVIISDMGEALGTATLQRRPSWRNELLSDGTTVQNAIPWNPDIASIFLQYQCTTALSANACKYCAVSALPDGAMLPSMPPGAFEAMKARSVEAITIALQNGWRGTILFTGGTPPRSRKDYGQVTDDMERVMTQFRESIDDEILSQIHFSEALFSPPDDLGLLEKWRDIGLNSTEFDSQVMDPDYFKAICPGRGDQRRWIEAQAASAEVFGRGLGATTAVVMGIEPMAGLVEGVEERIKRGVFTQVLTFVPAPGTPYGGFGRRRLHGSWRPVRKSPTSTCATQTHSTSI
ncbi:MAG: radical SAM protein [Myxococcota bacterium]